jgi:hypothetical protein
MLGLSLTIIPLGNSPFSLLALNLVATLLGILLCLFSSRWRISSLHTILVFTVVCRSLVNLKFYLEDNDGRCIAFAHDLFNKHLNMIFIVLDIIVFKVNILVSLCFGFPVFAGMQILNHVSNYHKEVCESSTIEIVFSYLGLAYLSLPAICATYLSQLNEMRLFFLSENAARNQVNMLDLFEKQYEGVILLAQAP